MKLGFLGTRGEIDARTPRHHRHSSLLVAYRGGSAIVDWGDDWRGEADRLRSAVIVLTHAHPDHAGGLRDGAPGPVYATAVASEALQRHPIEWRRVEPRRTFRLRGIRFEPFPVEHSVRAPAVGYRIELDLYVGDGAAVTRSIVRRRDGRLIGHASIRTQLDWCAAANVPRAVFTHCGSEIVKGDARAVAARVRALGRERGVRAEIAHDGLELTLR